MQNTTYCKYILAKHEIAILLNILFSVDSHSRSMACFPPPFCVYSLQMKKNLQKFFLQQNITTISDEERFPKELFFCMTFPFSYHIFICVSPSKVHFILFCIFAAAHSLLALQKKRLCVHIFVAVVFIKHSECT